MTPRSSAPVSQPLLRIRRMMVKELRQLLRDPKTKRVIFIAPVIQIILFGYAVNTDVRDVRVAVVDHDRSSASRYILQALESSGHFRIVHQSQNSATLKAALDHGTATLAVEVPPGFTRDLMANRSPAIQLLVDGSSSNTGTVAQGYATRVLQQALRDVRMQETPSAAPLLLETRAWFNPSLESRYYNVPAVTGVIVFLMCLMLTAMGVVREKELGTMEQLLVSPLRAREMILGKTLPVAIIAMIQLTIVTAVALLWFQVPFRGSVVAMLFAAFLFVTAGLSIGLLISTISATQQEAFLATFLLVLPAIILSGFMYPIESMPTFFRGVTWLNPLRHFLEIVRGQFLRGPSVIDLWVPYLTLLGLTLSGLGASVLRFRRSLQQ